VHSGIGQQTGQLPSVEKIKSHKYIDLQSPIIGQVAIGHMIGQTAITQGFFRLLSAIFYGYKIGQSARRGGRNGDDLPHRADPR
jgi:hypothetical protein